MVTASKTRVKSPFVKTALGFAYLCGLIVAIVVIVTVTRVHVRTLAHHTIPQPLWQSSAYGTPLASAGGIVVADTAFNPHSTGIVGLDAATGALRWRLYDVSFVGVDATHTQVFYVGDPTGRMQEDMSVGMVDAANGLLHWKFALPSGMATAESSVVLAGTDCFIFATSTVTNTTSPDFGRQTVYILDPRTGRQIGGYSLPTTLDFEDKPLVNGMTVYGFESGAPGPDAETTTVHAFNALTGKPLWQTEVTNAMDYVAADGALLVTTGSFSTSGSQGGDSQVLALDSKTGKERWSFTLSNSPEPPIATAQGVYIYMYSGSSGNSRIYALDPASGRVLWQNHIQPFRSEGEGPQIVAAGGTLYVGQSGMPDFALDAATGHELWQSPVSSPFFTVDGSLLAARVDTYLVVFSAHDGSIVWDWYSSIVGGAPIAANGKVFIETGAGLTAFNEQQ